MQEILEKEFVYLMIFQKYDKLQIRSQKKFSLVVSAPSRIFPIFLQPGKSFIFKDETIGKWAFVYDFCHEHALY